jgi:hypothetical protein
MPKTDKNVSEMTIQEAVDFQKEWWTNQVAEQQPEIDAWLKKNGFSSMEDYTKNRSQAQRNDFNRTFVHQRTSALGLYQFMRATLEGLISDGVVKPTDVMDADTQDRMAFALANQKKGVRKYFQALDAGREPTASEIDGAQNALAEIWAGIPKTSGESAHAGVGQNKSGKIPRDGVIQMLNDLYELRKGY